MWPQLLFIIFPLIRCLCGATDESVDYNRVNCGHNYENECVIEAVFGNFEAGDAVDVLINCTNHDELSPNQFSKIDKIIWNGCHTSWNIKALGLTKISRKNQVKYLRIENFATGILVAGTFDGFSRLETLSLQLNSIENLSSRCFRGLESLKVLEMIENGIKWMDAGLLSDLPKLKALEIVGSELLWMANHQFGENQIVDDASIEMKKLETDLLEHFLLHARNLSISLKLNDDSFCDQMRLDGYEKAWIVESLQLQNLRCGFVMKNLPSIKSLQLVQAVRYPFTYAGLELENLPKLEVIFLHENILQETKFHGAFDSLKFIDMSNNTLSEIDMGMFEKSFPNLRKINLNENFLSKLDGLSTTKFGNIQVFVDGNNFDCSWLNDVASSKAFQSFVFRRNFKSLNIDGLSCRNRQCPEHFPPTNETFCSSLFTDSADNEAQRELLMLKEDNFILRPEIFMIIVCASGLLGTALTFISICTYHKRQLLKHKPFYHLLRDSLRPISDARSTLGRDFKEIISRNLPPTNYEHPISDSRDSHVTEMTDVAANISNIYEEIPQKLY